MDISTEIMRRQGVEVDMMRAVDHQIASGVWPDMTEHGWEVDEWPEIFRRVMAADILVLGTPIWLGEKSSVHDGDRASLWQLQPTQQPWSVRLLREGRGLFDYGERRRRQALLDGDPVRPPASRLHDPSSGGCRVDRRSRPRALLSRLGLWGPGERLHQSEHHLHDLEPHAHGADPQGDRGHPRPRKPTVEMEAGCRFDFPNPDYR